jgi:hypothetical protein
VTPARWLALGALGPDGSRRWNQKGGHEGAGKYPLIALGSGAGWSWSTNEHRIHLAAGELRLPEPPGVLRSVTAEQIAGASEGALTFLSSSPGALDSIEPHIGPPDSLSRSLWKKQQNHPDAWLPVLGERCAVPEGAELRNFIEVERAKWREVGESRENEQEIRARLTRPRSFRLDKYLYNPFYLRDALRGLLHVGQGKLGRLPPSLWIRFPSAPFAPLALLSGSALETADRIALIRPIFEQEAHLPAVPA